MPDNALDSVLRLRGLIVQEAKRTLADRVRQEAALDASERAAEAEIASETARATAIEAGDGSVETYALWLRKAREELARTRQARDACAGRTAQARAELSLAKSAWEAAEAARAERLAEERMTTERRAQALTDEAALTAHRRRL
jgi:hypothetical protein